MKIAIYARKSRTTEKGESIANQIELCKHYAELHFQDSECDIYQDEGYSGGDINRPSFLELTEALKAGRYHVLICYRLDRISRNVLDFSATLDMLTKNNVAFVSIKENFDTTSPMGRAMLHISSVFAQLERETIAERIRDNMQELAKTGRWLGGTVPVGYKAIRLKEQSDSGKIKNYSILQIDKKKVFFVEMLFKQYLQFKSLSKLERYLIGNSIQTDRGKYYHPQVLRSILSNPVYCCADQEVYQYFSKLSSCLSNSRSDFNGRHGLMVYNKNRKGKLIYKNNASEWIVAVGAHDPIIDSKTWLMVQRQLVANAHKVHSHASSSVALLSGILFCKACGAKMLVMNQSVLKDGTKSYIYRCSNKLKSRGNLCNIENAKGHYLDEYVLKSIMELLMDQKWLLEKLTKVYQDYDSCFFDTKSERRVIEEQVVQKEKTLAKLIRLSAENEDVLLESSYENEIKKVKNEMMHLREKLSLTKTVIAEVVPPLSNDSQLFDLITDIRQYRNQKINNELQHLIKSIIKYAKWNGNTLFLYLYDKKNE